MRPEAFDNEHAVDWSRWVLENGLPALPQSELAVGGSVPVAYWIGPTTAAVLHIRRIRIEDDDEDVTETDIDLFYLVDGRWELYGGGGGGWDEQAPLERQQVPSDYAELGGMNSNSINERGCKALWGVVGIDAAVAEVYQAGQVIRREVEAPVGALVVSGEYSQPMTVRILTDAGDVLAVVEEPARFEGVN